MEPMTLMALATALQAVPGIFDMFTEQPDPALMSPEQRQYQQMRYTAGLQQWQRQLLGDEPQFGFISTQTPEQQQILSQLMGVQPGAEERAGVLSRLMAVSPEEETAAIRAMSEPAMRQFQEEILPATRQPFHAAGTTWSTMRAREEAKRGVDLAERLAKLGEQYRMERRRQALTATGQSTAEALGRQGILSGILGMSLQDYYTYGQYKALSHEERARLSAMFPGGVDKWDWNGDGEGEPKNGNGNGGNGPPPPPPPPPPDYDYYDPTAWAPEAGYKAPPPDYPEFKPILTQGQFPAPVGTYTSPYRSPVKKPTLSSLMEGRYY